MAMAAKKIPYINRFNGEIVIATRQSAKRLNEDWEKIEFTENDQGKRVARLHLNGATVDISENEVAENGNARSK
jgi:hypothetical protein